MTIRTTTRNASAIADALRNCEDFTTPGALKGVANPRFVNFGRMPVVDASAMYRARDDVGIDYVVYSYGTAIAYRTENKEWVVPDAKYSVTTSRHQSTIRYALTLIGAR